MDRAATHSDRLDEGLSDGAVARGPTDACTHGYTHVCTLQSRSAIDKWLDSSDSEDSREVLECKEQVALPSISASPDGMPGACMDRAATRFDCLDEELSDGAVARGPTDARVHVCTHVVSIGGAAREAKSQGEGQGQESRDELVGILRLRHVRDHRLERSGYHRARL